MLLSKNPAAIFRRESRPTISHVTRIKFVFAASEVAILRVSAEHQLMRAKDPNGPETQHNLQEVSNSDFVPTDREESLFYSGKFDCVEF